MEEGSKLRELFSKGEREGHLSLSIIEGYVLMDIKKRTSNKWNMVLLVVWYLPKWGTGRSIIRHQGFMQ